MIGKDVHRVTTKVKFQKLVKPICDLRLVITMESMNLDLDKDNN